MSPSYRKSFLLACTYAFGLLPLLLQLRKILSHRNAPGERLSPPPAPPLPAMSPEGCCTCGCSQQNPMGWGALGCCFRRWDGTGRVQSLRGLGLFSCGTQIMATLQNSTYTNLIQPQKQRPAAERQLSDWPKRRKKRERVEMDDSKMEAV